MLYHAAKQTLCVDHHRTNAFRADYNWVEPFASSTCEVLTKFLQKAEIAIPKNAATALYLGIVTDSNRFLYDTARADCMRTAADLIDCGADVDSIYYSLYQNMEKDAYRYQAYVVEKTKYFCNGRVALVVGTKEDLEKYGQPEEAMEAVVDIVKNFSGVEVTAMIKEREENVQKVSFRSKEYYDVSRLALRFGGGGHKKAAGATLSFRLPEAEKIIQELLESLGEDLK